MELDRDRIADIAQRHGVYEREALILYHLGHAFELYFEIAKEEDYGYDVNLQDWVDHHTGLVNLLMRRVVRRDHHGGWRTAGEIIALREAEQQCEAEDRCHTPSAQVAKMASRARRACWLGRLDSNQGSRNQNPLPYHLATPQCRSAART